MPWYDGPTLMEYLEAWRSTERLLDAHSACPVQWVNRPPSDFRGFAGTIVSGRYAPGDEIVDRPVGRETGGADRHRRRRLRSAGPARR